MGRRQNWPEYRVFALMVFLDERRNFWQAFRTINFPVHGQSRQSARSSARSGYITFPSVFLFSILWSFLSLRVVGRPEPDFLSMLWSLPRCCRCRNGRIGRSQSVARSSFFDAAGCHSLNAHASERSRFTVFAITVRVLSVESSSQILSADSFVTLNDAAWVVLLVRVKINPRKIGNFCPFNFFLCKRYRRAWV